MAKKKVPAREAKAISGRLRDFAKRRCGSIEEFRRRLRVPRTTGVAWFGGRHPSVPEVPFLLRLAREMNVSLDWLLLGEGPELRETPEDTPAGRVRAAIEAELRSSEPMPLEKFEAAWLLLSGWGDFNIDDVVLQLAVGGVRPRFQECVRLTEHYARLTPIYNHMRLAYMRLREHDIAGADAIAQQFEETWSELVPESPKT